MISTLEIFLALLKAIIVVTLAFLLFLGLAAIFSMSLDKEITRQEIVHKDMCAKYGEQMRKDYGDDVCL